MKSGKLESANRRGYTPYGIISVACRAVTVASVEPPREVVIHASDSTGQLRGLEFERRDRDRRVEILLGIIRRTEYQIGRACHELGHHYLVYDGVSVFDAGGRAWTGLVAATESLRACAVRAVGSIDRVVSG